MLMLGIRGTKTSPPRILPRQRMANSTPCSSVIQKRVMPLVGQGDLAEVPLVAEERDDAAAAADDVAVAHAAHARAVRLPL